MHRPYLDIDDRVDSLLSAERRLPQAVSADFGRKFLMSWLHHDLSLEGIVANEDDIVRALANRDGRDYCDDVLLQTVRNFRAAMHLVRNAAIRREPITRAWIEQLHDTLAGAPVANRYRTDDGATEQYKHDVVAPAHIADELDAVVREIQTRAFTTHPLQLAAVVHYRFARIWPFESLSGAVGRLLANRILLEHGYPPVIYPSYDRQRYYHAMHYDVTRLHDLMLEFIHAQLDLRERFVRSRTCAPRPALRAS